MHQEQIHHQRSSAILNPSFKREGGVVFHQNLLAVGFQRMWLSQHMATRTQRDEAMKMAQDIHKKLKKINWENWLRDCKRY